MSKQQAASASTTELERRLRERMSSALSNEEELNDHADELRQLSSALLDHVVNMEGQVRKAVEAALDEGLRSTLSAVQNSFDAFIDAFKASKKKKRSASEVGCQYEQPLATSSQLQDEMEDDNSNFQSPQMLETTVLDRPDTQGNLSMDDSNDTVVDVNELMMRDDLPDVDDSWDDSHEYSSVVGSPSQIAETISLPNKDSSSNVINTSTATASTTGAQQATAEPAETTVGSELATSSIADSSSTIVSPPSTLPNESQKPTIVDETLVVAETPSRIEPATQSQEAAAERSEIIVSPTIPTEESALDTTLMNAQAQSNKKAVKTPLDDTIQAMIETAANEQSDTEEESVVTAKPDSGSTRRTLMPEDIAELCVDCAVVLERLDLSSLKIQDLDFFNSVKKQNKIRPKTERTDEEDEFAMMERLMRDEPKTGYYTRSQRKSQSTKSTDSSSDIAPSTSGRRKQRAESPAPSSLQTAEEDEDDLPDLDFGDATTTTSNLPPDDDEEAGELNSDNEEIAKKKTKDQKDSKNSKKELSRSDPIISPVPFSLRSDDDSDEISKPLNKSKSAFVLDSDSSNENFPGKDSKKTAMKRKNGSEEEEDEDDENRLQIDETKSTGSDTPSIDDTVEPKTRRKRRSGNQDRESDSIPKGYKRLKMQFKREKDVDLESVPEERLDDEEDDDVIHIDEKDVKPSTSKQAETRRKIRKIRDESKLAKETREAERMEKERRKRIAERNKAEQAIIEELKPDDGRVVLDYDLTTKKPVVVVDEYLSSVLKPHQVEGVKFMWKSCFESLEKFRDGDPGSGCLLAHCMGLGKTLQVTTLLHTVLTNPELKEEIKKALVIMPKNVLINWKQEITKWTKQCHKRINVLMFPIDPRQDENLNRLRASTLAQWNRRGGIFLMSYPIFTKLVGGKGIKPKKHIKAFEEALVNPGPDIVVCDEGHMLKSELTLLSQCCSLIQTPRRIILTGTPLQNNLLEYHCMVQFIKPNLLGNKSEFVNRFANPINNGQMKDSTDADVRYMKKRAHVLHDTLDGCIQRKDHNVIRELLEPKNEYVLSIKLSEKQIELYKSYLGRVRNIESVSDVGRSTGAQLFVDCHNLNRVCTHPWAVKLHDEKTKADAQRASTRAAEKRFIADNEDDDADDVADAESVEGAPSKNADAASTSSTGDTDDPVPVVNWWSDIIKPEDEDSYQLGCKLVIFESILKKCSVVGDKLLVFSQFKYSLDIIEKYLKKMHNSVTYSVGWERDKDYFRMDGATEVSKRMNQVEMFNDLQKTRCRLFLISTKAGGIGINLVGANRCIIFDASFNPCYDTQSIYRIYRFGQIKPVYVYRFLAFGTMEEKIYQRQIIKQSLSQRVIDEHQLDRHYTRSELAEMYRFEPDKWEQTPLDYPQDDVLKEVISECKQMIMKIHEHDSLLENKLDQGLSDEDRAAAWAEYEADKDREQARAEEMRRAAIPLNPSYQNIPANDLSMLSTANLADLFRLGVNPQGLPFVTADTLASSNIGFQGGHRNLMPNNQGQHMAQPRYMAPSSVVVTNGHGQNVQNGQWRQYTPNAQVAPSAVYSNGARYNPPPNYSNYPRAGGQVNTVALNMARPTRAPMPGSQLMATISNGTMMPTMPSNIALPRTQMDGQMPRAQMQPQPMQPQGHIQAQAPPKKLDQAIQNLVNQQLANSNGPRPGMNISLDRRQVLADETSRLNQVPVQIQAVSSIPTTTEQH